jgi:hypothetical protein
MSLGKTTFEAAYQVSPIILQGGIAQFVGGYLPITAVTEVLDVPGWTGGQFFAQYRPLPGGTLEEWQVAEYPFASFQTAANAVVQQPLKISMQMICPAQNAGGYILKQAILSALKLVLDQHILSGGSFTVITPAFTYTNCLLTGLRDISSPSDKQVQYMFQWDFVQPLITESAAQSALQGFLDKVSNQLPSNSSWTNSSFVTPSYNTNSGWSIK